ncbi:MAG: calcium/sodium antiporter [Verrucomicrobiota bacterium]
MLDTFLILIGLVLLYYGGEGVVSGAVAISLKMGLPKLVVGLTVLAFSTSSPELFVCVKAALQENGGIALGNVVGSNIANIALILGIAACICPLEVHQNVIRQQIPVLILASVAFIYFLYDGMMTFSDGIILLIGLGVYILISLLNAKKYPDEEQSEELIEAESLSSWRAALYLLAGLVGLILGAECMVTGAVKIASSMGISEAVIGLTVVSIGTSLPELATCIVAAMKKEVDIVTGNLIGSNVFNIGAIMGCTAVVHPVVNQGITAIDWGVMLFLTLMMIPIMITGFRVNRFEGSLLVSFYALYIAYLVLTIPGTSA